MYGGPTLIDNYYGSRYKDVFDGRIPVSSPPERAVDSDHKLIVEPIRAVPTS
jgi:hypothetical protein